MKTKLIFAVIYLAFISVILAEAVMTYPKQNSPDLLIDLAQHSDRKRWHKTLSHIKPSILKTKLEILFPNATIVAHDKNSKLIVFCQKQNLGAIKNVCYRWDKAPRQIQIEVKIIEVASTKFEYLKSALTSIGEGVLINYDPEDNKIKPLSQLEGTLIQLFENGEAKLIAKPSISTLDNHKAKIEIGDRLPYVTTTIMEGQIKTNNLHQINTGVSLEITAKSTENDFIYTELKSNISSVKLWKEINGTKYPVLSTRKVENILHIKNKETLVIAGLIQEEINNNKTGLPILSKIPILGRLFRSNAKLKSQSDVLIFITPTIMN